MIDFKVLVSVPSDNPVAALKVLGEKVTGDERSFLSVDPKWIAQQAYIAAVPIEVALTVEMREVVQQHDPETRFIVTGVTPANVENLINMFDYKVWPGVPVTKVCDDEENKKLTVAKKEEVPAEPVSTKKFYYNGKEVSEKEFKKYRERFLNNWTEFWGETGQKFLEKLFDM